MSGLKDLFRGKPKEQAAEEKPWWPTSDDPARSVNPIRPVSGGYPEPAAPPGVYAGPPAYRWFGYGSPTPGANQFAPSGLYPKGSANWYAQTGATPGAFPIPVTLNPRPTGVEPPTYAGWATPAEPTYLAGTRVMAPESPPQRPQPVFNNRMVAPSNVRRPASNETDMPYGSGTLVTSAPAYESPSSADPAWQPISGRYPQPINYTTPSAAPPMKSAPSSVDPSWSPSQRTIPNQPPGSVPSISMIRGQAPEPDDAVDIPARIRAACFGRASGVGITVLGAKKLLVVLEVPTESDARDAAALVSRLPELKSYTVTFEVTIRR
jgi:hypothetical protein